MNDGSTREITPEEVALLATWLAARPPYELVGRIVCEAARLELGLIHCAVLAGVDPERLRKMRTSDIVKELRKEKYSGGAAQAHPDFLDRVQELLKSRDEVAHAHPMHMWGDKDFRFIKHDRSQGDAALSLFKSESDLVNLGEALDEAAELLAHEVRTRHVGLA